MTMLSTKLHGKLLAQAFDAMLGRPELGAMAFVRCLTPDVVEALAAGDSFVLSNWRVWRVADLNAREARTITADHAVELRESKSDPTLLLVDTVRAGAGMDGIYSATREVDETSLFNRARRLAANEVSSCLSRGALAYAERAVKKARRLGQRFSISPWVEFDYMVRVAAERRHPGEFLHLLGLWPVKEGDQGNSDDGLDVSRFFVDWMLGATSANLTPAQRIEAVKLLNPSTQQICDLQ